MIFNTLGNYLKTKKDMPFTIIIDNALIKIPNSTNYLQVLFDGTQLKFGRMDSNSHTFKSMPETIDLVMNALTCETLGEIDLHGLADVNNYSVMVNTELRIVFMNTSPLMFMFDKMRGFNGNSDVRFLVKGGEIRNYTAKEFEDLYYNVVSELYERYRETCLDFLINRLLRSRDMARKVKGRLLRIRNGFVPVFVYVEGLIPPTAFPLVKKIVDDSKIKILCEEIGEEMIINGVSVTFLTHREVCIAFGLDRFVEFNIQLIQDLLYARILVNTKSDFRVDDGGVYLLVSGSSSPDRPMIKLDNTDNDNSYAEVPTLALRLFKNRKYASNIYNTLRLLINYDI